MALRRTWATHVVSVPSAATTVETLTVCLAYAQPGLFTCHPEPFGKLRAGSVRDLAEHARLVFDGIEEPYSQGAYASRENNSIHPDRFLAPLGMT